MKFKCITQRLLAPDDGAGTGTDTTITTEGTVTEGAATTVATTTPSKTFTQEEVNAMMKKEKESGRTSILKDLGVEDAKSAKDGLTKYKEYLDSQKTEAEKQAEALRLVQESENTTKSLLARAEAKVVSLSAGVNPNALEDIVSLVLSKVTDDNNLETVIKDMKENEVYRSLFTVDVNSSKPSSKGTGNSVVSKVTGSANLSLGQRLANSSTKTQAKSSYFSR